METTEIKAMLSLSTETQLLLESRRLIKDAEATYNRGIAILYGDEGQERIMQDEDIFIDLLQRVESCLMESITRHYESGDGAI